MTKKVATKWKERVKQDRINRENILKLQTFTLKLMELNPCLEEDVKRYIIEKLLSKTKEGSITELIKEKMNFKLTPLKFEFSKNKISTGILGFTLNSQERALGVC